MYKTSQFVLTALLPMAVTCETMMPMRNPRHTRSLMSYLGPILLALTANAACASSSPLIDINRLASSLTRMQSGIHAEGGCSNNIAYSTAHRDALRQLSRHLQSAGMMTHRDVAGNLIGRVQGKHASPPLIVGAHIDTASAEQPCSGIAGMMAAVEVARTLHDNGTVLNHPLEIIVWADSAGRMLGSRSVYDDINPAEIGLRRSGNASVADGIAYLGGEPNNLAFNQRPAGTIAAYLEIRVDLDAAHNASQADLGIVNEFVGSRRWAVTLSGEACSAPSSRQCPAIRDAARRFSAAVSDFGQTTAIRATELPAFTPTSSALINDQAADVRFRLDIHGRDTEQIERLFAAIRGLAKRISEQTGTRFYMEPVFELPTVEADRQVQEAIGTAASELQLSYDYRYYDAGHDAQGLSRLAPVGLIIVAGGAGNQELRADQVAPEALANGANALLRTLLELDRQPQERNR